MKRTVHWVCHGVLAATLVGCVTAPKEVPVARLDVSPASAGPIAPGATVTLSATPRDGSGNALTGRTVTWASGSPSVATVSTSGVVTAVAEGSATITATSGGINGSASVLVVIPVASVTVTPATQNMIIGTSQTFSAVAKSGSGATLSGRAITWASSNTSVVTVTASGVVTAVAPGAAVVTATADGVSGGATVTVAPIPVATVSVSPASFTLMVPGTQTLTATPKDAAGNTLTGRTVVWTSSNAAVATISQSGVVTGVGAGTVTLTANVEGVTASSTATVSAVPVASVTVSPSTVSIVQGSAQALTATAKDASGATLSGRAVTWSSSNTAVATVSAAGVLTAVAAGTATITATAEGKSGTAAVTVRSLALEPAAVTTSATAADTTQRVIVLAGLTGTWNTALSVRNSTGGALAASSVRWIARDTTRATVSSSGIITGVRAGRTFVVAQSINNTAIADSVLVFVPQNSAGPLLRAANPTYRIVATDTFSITLQIDMRDGKSLSAADFEVAWPGSAAYPYDPFTVTSITPLRSGVVAQISPDLTETARVTFATTTPVAGTVALVRLNCRVNRRGVANQIVLTLNQAVASDLSDQTSLASVLNLMVIIP